jgi:hypothetical protein
MKSPTRLSSLFLLIDSQLRPCCAACMLPHKRERLDVLDLHGLPRSASGLPARLMFFYLP